MREGFLFGRSIHYLPKEVDYAFMEEFALELESISHSLRNRFFDKRVRCRCCWNQTYEKHFLDSDVDIPDD
jgi:hypothetical protein